jgi:hypothetical protein
MHLKALKQLAEAGLKSIAVQAEKEHPEVPTGRSEAEKAPPEHEGLGVGMGTPEVGKSTGGHAGALAGLKSRGVPPLKKADIPDREFDSQELVRGMDTELEHTDDLEVAKAIAKAHLCESKDYYKRLEKMEIDDDK